jgi:hypothetical protein
MLIGLVQSAERSGTRSLTYDDKTKSFRMEGAGEILPAKLIDLANRQQILWTDLAVRAWTLRTASALLRETKTEAGRSRARAAAAAVASGTGKHASGTRAPARPSGPTLRTSNGRLPSAPSEQLTPVPPSASGMGGQPSPGSHEGVANQRQVQASSDSQAQILPDAGAPDVRHVWPWLILAALCVTVVGLGFAYPREIRHQLAISFSRQPTPYTELYFTNPQTIPTFLSVSRPDSCSFTIANHEGRARTYSYVVTLSSSQGTSTVGSGTIGVEDGGAATRLVEVGPAKPGRAYTVTVKLLGRSETIHFSAFAKA